MDLGVLKTFCDLVDTGSFSKAAELSLISQSAASQQLAKLERQFATQLVSRGGGVVQPTDAGKAFYAGAREILRRYEQMLGEVDSAATSVRGVLRVGTIYSVGFYLLNPVVCRFIQAHPDVSLKVEYTHWSRISAAVISGEMDLGVVACPEKNRSLEIIPLASEELVMVCSPEHALARRRQVRPAELSGKRFVAFEQNIPTRRHIDRLLKRHRVKVDVVMEFDNTEVLKRAVEVNSGVSILPRENVDREVAHGNLCFARFDAPAEWTRPVAILRRRGKTPGPAERMFLGLLRSQA